MKTRLISIILLVGILSAYLSYADPIDMPIDMETEDVPPEVWLDPNSRVVYHNNADNTDILVERVENYAFFGEQIHWDVLVYDPNGLEKILDVFVVVSDDVEPTSLDIEVNCDMLHIYNNYAESVLHGANRLVQLQSDITEDNAGNGDPDADLEDGGWDWVLSDTVTEHSAVLSPPNLYGVTAEGVLAAYQINNSPRYRTSLEDVYTAIQSSWDDYVAAITTRPRIRSGTDVIFLMKMFEEFGDAKYQTLARNIYDEQITNYGSATALAEFIRDVRGVTQGYKNGIIPWDLSHWVEAAERLGEDSDADDIAQVIWDDMYLLPADPGYTGFFDFTNKSEWWYYLGIAGALDSFITSDTHPVEAEQLRQILVNDQNADGGWQWNDEDPESDYQSTAYVIFALVKTGNRVEVREGAEWLAMEQNANGGWSFSTGNEYPEIDGEATGGVFGIHAAVMRGLAATIEIPDGREFPLMFNPDTMSWYTCILTIETQESMYGPKWIGVMVEDLDLNTDTFDELEYWFLNPDISIDVEGIIDFGEVRPGTLSYSMPVVVTNNAEYDSGILLDMFISGTDFTDPANSGAKCPDSNRLDLENFAYYATNGAYHTLTGDPRENGIGGIEGYYMIPYEDGNEITREEIIEGDGTINLGGKIYQAGNVLSPGADMTLIFRMNLPLPCNGDFSDGSIYIWAEAI